MVVQAWFVDGFLAANMLTPAYILILFIVSVLASVWALETLVRYGATKRSAAFVGVVDLCFFGALIAGVYQLGDIASTNCGDFERTGTSFLASLGPFGYFGQRAGWDKRAGDPKKVCAMLKSSFAFGIMNIVSFLVTAILTWFIHHHEDRHDDDRHRSSRRSSHSRRRDHHYRRSGSASGRQEYHV